MNLRANLVMRLHVRIEKPISVGRTAAGQLSIIPIVGGAFEGPEIRGEVCPGGADWNTRISETHSHVLARYWLKTSDGEYISIENEGMIDSHNRDRIILTTPRFQVDLDGKYGYLASGAYVGELKVGDDPGQVVITIYQMD